MILKAIKRLSEINSDEEYASMLSLLPELRKQHIASFKNKNDKSRSIVAGYLLQRLLEENGFGGLDASISVDEFGKGHLPEKSGLYFSIAHSRDCVFVVLADHPVGCDVESIGRGSLEIAKRYFSKSECEALESSADFHESFARYWTCKEAYIKLEGMGLRIPLDSFSISDSFERIIGKDVCLDSWTDGGYAFGIATYIRGF